VSTNELISLFRPAFYCAYKHPFDLLPDFNNGLDLENSKKNLLILILIYYV